MGANPVKRKLAAILAADAVGYSRLMAADEEKTMKILSAHRAVIDGIIEFHEGRIVGTAGDSVLAEFGSPVEAVRCAVEVQDALKTRNDSLPEIERMLFRIGVNLGDVIAKDDDLLGDGVNIAARLEGIAEPGGICVSSSVYDQIAGKLDLGFVDIGTQSLKNIQRPIQVYRIERQGRRVAVAVAAPAPPQTRGAWLAGALAFAVIAGGLAWYLDLIPGVPSPERARAEAELARKRVEAEDAKRRAEIEATRAKEEQRAAKSRALMEADLARARAETEAARQKTRELVAAEEARRAAEPSRPRPPRTAEAAPKIASSAPVAAPARIAAPASSAAFPQRYDGPWAAEISCRAFSGRRAFTSNVQFSVADNMFDLQYGQRGQAGSFHVSGTAQPDGRLQLLGDGFVAATGKRKAPQPYKAAFDGKFDAGRFAASGHLGAQECTLAISRAP